MVGTDNRSLIPRRAEVIGIPPDIRGIFEGDDTLSIALKAYGFIHGIASLTACSIT
jgi:hypothetical protein